MPTSPAPPPAEPATPAPRQHFLVQAPVSALDVDGLNVVTIGLVVFGIASIVAGVFYGDLAARGNGWWLWVCLSGFALGLPGLAYCANRRRRRLAGERLD